LIPFGHLGWGYRDRAEFLDRAAEYITDGIARHQGIEYVGEGSREELLAELATMPGVADHLDTGGIGVSAPRDFYVIPPGSDVVDPEAAVAAYLSGVNQAIEDGYTGFRAVVDATAVTRSAEGRDAFACFEFLVDQVMAVQPVSALCAYDLTQLPDSAAELICLHPFTDRRARSFRIYAEIDSDYSLTGEIDAASEELLSTTMQRIGPLTGDGQLVIDAQGLKFISHRQLLQLDHYARAHDRQVVLRTAQPILVRLAGLLDLTNVEVVPPPSVGG
jgi:anti-anti-sigma regulatory factor